MRSGQADCGCAIFDDFAWDWKSALHIRTEYQQRAAEQASTVSIGVACLEPGEEAASVLKRADQAMYAARHAGRNRVHVDGLGALLI